MITEFTIGQTVWTACQERFIPIPLTFKAPVDEFHAYCERPDTGATKMYSLLELQETPQAVIDRELSHLRNQAANVNYAIQRWEGRDAT